jgi:hypothetical protein
MLCMKWHVFGFFVFMMSAGAVWAGERGYQLAAGTESKLCARVLDAFREDVDDRGRLRYQHEIFRQITWKPVELKGQAPKTRHCSSLDQAIFDGDHSGQPDLVVKTTFCMQGSPSDSLLLTVRCSNYRIGKTCPLCWRRPISSSGRAGPIP